MSGIESFDDLIELGPSRVHEQTHISRDKLVLLFSKSYNKINKVQFMGYISILEREYKLDLQSIKNEYFAYMQNNQVLENKATYTLLQPKKRFSLKRIVLWLLVIVAAVLIFIKFDELKPNDNNILVANEENISTINPNIEANSSIEKNSTIEKSIIVEANSTMQQKEEPIAIESGYKIIPKYNLWYGVKDLDSNVTTQATTKDEITVDSSKRLLFILGHGKIEILQGSDIKKLDSKRTLYLLSENGQFTQLSHEEFVKQNGDREWGK